MLIKTLENEKEYNFWMLICSKAKSVEYSKVSDKEVRVIFRF